MTSRPADQGSAQSGSCPSFGLGCGAADDPMCSAFERLNASACVVDDAGMIIRTNAAWNGFADDVGAGACSSNCIGLNYIETCRKAGENGDTDAAAMADRLEALVKGCLTSFQLEYPCETPTGMRWYVASANAFLHSGRRWTVVTHDDVTAHKFAEAVLDRANVELNREARRKEEMLRWAEERAKLVAEVSSDGIWDWEPKDDRLSVSQRMARMLGDMPIANSAGLLARVHADDAGLILAMLARRASGCESFEAEARFLGEDDRPFWAVLRGYCVAVQGGMRVVGTLTDITARKAMEEAARAGAGVDELTGLPSRVVFLDRLSQALRYGGAAVLAVDLDGFSAFNDRLGHRGGDAILREAGWRMTEAVGAGAAGSDACVARLASDEFAIFLPGVDMTGAERVAAGLLNRFGEPSRLSPKTGFPTASVGLTMVALGAEASAEDAVAQAEFALHRAKAAGGNSWICFEPEMRRATLLRHHITRAMGDALSGQGDVDPAGFRLVYQPIIDVRPGDDNGRLMGYEALARWTHPEMGPLSPAEFIPVAEQTGLIVDLGDWVMRRACRQLAAWIADAPPLDGRQPFVGVNVAAQQLARPDFEDRVLSCLGDSGLKPGNLKIEVTESSLVANPFAVAGVLARLADRGVRLSIDDFGTGFSSLSYLARFRFHELKIDRSFVRDMLENPRAATVVESIARLGLGLAMDVIAEGVERPEELEAVRRIGCHGVQGYLLGRPTEAADVDPARLAGAP